MKTHFPEVFLVLSKNLERPSHKRGVLSFSTEDKYWACQDSNLEPPRYKLGALPLSYMPVDYINLFF